MHIFTFYILVKVKKHTQPNILIFQHSHCDITAQPCTINELTDVQVVKISVFPLTLLVIVTTVLTLLRRL